VGGNIHSRALEQLIFWSLSKFREWPRLEQDAGHITKVKERHCSFNDTKVLLQKNGIRKWE